jgi:hypothetical protein
MSLEVTAPSEDGDHNIADDDARRDSLNMMRMQLDEIEKVGFVIFEIL